MIAFECGAIVNPDGLHNQVEGSVVQGLGGALFEAIEFADGHIRNGSMEQYRVPRFKDTPLIDVILLDRPRPAVRRRRRGLDGVCRPGDRERRPRLRQGRHRVAGPNGVMNARDAAVPAPRHGRAPAFASRRPAGHTCSISWLLLVS